MKKILILFVIACFSASIAQETLITGKVSDASTNEAIAFANIYIKGTNILTQTDFDGNYKLKLKSAHDSITCGYFGYALRSKKIVIGKNQTINFQLEVEGVALQEVVIKATENPAYRIIRNAVKAKEVNDKRNLKAYQYNNYSKVELDIDNISNKMKKRRMFRKIGEFMDSLQKISGEDGKPILPIFISEAISEVYFADNLPKTTEKILATKVTGIGLDDASLVSQIIGSTFQEYNFYKNYLTIVNKDFPSPIADSWKIFYDYYLADSMFVGNDWCYKIELEPRNERDLAFKGVIWITDSTWALKRVDVTVDNKANLNFVEKIKIQQESEPTSAGAWMPVKSRVLIDIAELADSTAGMIAKFYTSSKNIIVNQPKDPKFYQSPIIVAEDSKMHDQDYWVAGRHDTLSQTEKNVFLMVDSLKKLPVIKSYVEIIDIAINGYKKAGPIDIGPYLFAYSRNNLEQHRFRLGFRTNTKFSKKLMFKVYGAYGIKDDQWKYGLFGKYIFSRKQWTEMGLERKEDIGQLAFMQEGFENNGLFSAFARFGRYRGPLWMVENNFYFMREIRSGFTPKVYFKYHELNPMFNFGFFENPNNPSSSSISTSYQNAEATFEIRYAHRELFLQNDNERVSLGTDKWPIITLKYSRGIKGVFNKSDFNYDKLSINFSQRFRFGLFGKSSYSISSTKYFSPLPYTLLGVHLGNETFFYNSSAFNLMNFFEFVSDEFTSLHYSHQFEGFFFNRIPLMKRLKWREMVGATALIGDISSKNLKYIPIQYQTVNNEPAYNGLGGKPYVEISYGIENIFKFIRLTFVHRLTHLDKPYEINRFGVKVSAVFRL